MVSIYLRVQFFGLTRKVGSIAVALKGEEPGVAVVWLANVLDYNYLRGTKMGQERKVRFVQYMAVTAT